MPNASSKDLLRRCAVPLLALLLGGCSTLDYYAHLGQGQWQLLQARQPVERLLPIAEVHVQGGDVEHVVLRRQRTHRVQVTLEELVVGAHVLLLVEVRHGGPPSR